MLRAPLFFLFFRKLCFGGFANRLFAEQSIDEAVKPELGWRLAISVLGPLGVTCRFPKRAVWRSKSLSPCNFIPLDIAFRTCEFHPLVAFEERDPRHFGLWQIEFDFAGSARYEAVTLRPVVA